MFQNGSETNGIFPQVLSVLQPSAFDSYHLRDSLAADYQEDAAFDSLSEQAGCNALGNRVGDCDIS